MSGYAYGNAQLTQGKTEHERLVERLLAWSDWVDGSGACQECGARVDGRENRARHAAFHRRAER